jgi:Dyp-type peroxidase family
MTTATTQPHELSPAAKADIQGFITSGFGHLPHSAYLFVEVRDRTRAQAWLQHLWPHITTSGSWRPQADEAKVRPARTVNIAFTYAGLSALGMPAAALYTFPEEFRAGMAAETRSRMLGDTGASAPAQWELGGPHNEPIHAVLILNAQTAADLGAWCREQRTWLEETQGGVVEQVRSTQTGARPEAGTEPFGFFDGVAQPQIKGIKGEGVRTGEFIFGYENEYGFFPVSPLVPAVDDPARILPASANPFHRTAGYRDFGMNGTFVVYRKLAQDVAGFWRFVQNESIRSKGAVNPQFMVWLATKMVGRWPSGAPLILAPDRDRPDLRTDDFLYADSDPNALLCPFGSHIRRTNPRDQLGHTGPTESLHMTSRHRIMRRGKPYGPPLFDPAVLRKLDQPEALQALVDLRDDEQPRGVHFLCANANIKSQFEFIQQVWVNNPAFGGLLNNRDPLVGDNDAAEPPSVMVIPGRPATLRTSPLPRFIRVCGGAYFFMPSLTALRYLAEKLP